MIRLTGYTPSLFKLCTRLAATAGIVLACASTLSAQDRLFVLLPQRQGPQGHVVNLFDTLTNQVSVLPVLPSGSNIVAVDSSRSRVFADAHGEIFILDGQLGTVRGVHGSSALPSSKGAYASSTERLFIGRERSLGAQGQAAIDVVDVAAGRNEPSRSRQISSPVSLSTATAVGCSSQRFRS